MDRVNRILNHQKYKENYQQLQELECNREFCGHSLNHFMDVARLAYIFVLEEGILAEREIIYAAALLHDIGRHMEYTKGIPHHEASARIAEEILPACGFTEAETSAIAEAILAHRKVSKENGLNQILYRADKMSRSCFSCQAQDRCNWSQEKKNMQIKY